MIQQLTLGVSLRDDATFKNFVSASNQHLLHRLNVAMTTSGGHFLYLWGRQGVGKTHLLQACCHQAFGRHSNAMYLSLADKRLRPEVLCNLEEMDFVFLDNIDAVLKRSLWEESLLHFYNRLRDRGRVLVVAADSSPIHNACRLADLQSRLSWGLTFEVKAINDEQKVQALRLRARDRGLVLSDEVGKFLLRRYPRDMTALFDALGILDQASLAAKRRLTIPFVKQTLGMAL